MWLSTGSITAMTWGKPFQKGQSGNPGGRPKLPKELLKVKPFIPEEVERIIAKYMRLTKGELQRLLKEESDDLPMFEALVCSILGNAYKSGDYSKVEFLLTRTVGKVKDKIEHSSGKDNETQVVVYIPKNGREVKDEKKNP